MKRRLAILYQATPPPIIDGIRKTVKPGGYSDSGADIAFALRSYWKGGDVVTLTDTPEVTKDLDWVFPDTEEGILGAIDKGTLLRFLYDPSHTSPTPLAGADTLWLNTVLFTDHPLARLLRQRPTEFRALHVVGQLPGSVQVCCLLNW